MKNSKVFIYIAAIFLSGVIALIYLSQGQSEKTEPKLKLSYFKTNIEIADAVTSLLKQELVKEKYFWFGIEPGIPNQLEILKDLKQAIEKSNGAFDLVYIDQELKLPIETRNLFGNTIECELKQDWATVASEIKKNAGKNILLITAAVYSTNLLMQNPVNKISTSSGILPMTFSMGYFSANAEEEKKNIFPCLTDDKEGVAGWGCLIVNKSRSQRRRLDVKKLNGAESSMIGLMDLTGKKDYMLLIR